MDNIVAWLDHKPASARLGSLLTLAFVPLLLVAVVAVFFAPAAPLVGCVAGVALFVAAYGYWHTMLTDEQQDQTNLKTRKDLRSRRGIVGAGVAVWIIALLLTGPYLPDAALGTVNVFVAITAYWLWRATPEEAAAALARWEAEQAAQQSGQQDLARDDGIV